MSKKIMKRSLALGALMAFVITGSAMAAEVNPTKTAQARFNVASNESKVVEDTKFDNLASGTRGGVINNSGTLKLDYCKFENNTITAQNGGDTVGGAINNEKDGVLEVINSEFKNNGSMGMPKDGLGGAIKSYGGKLSLDNVTFTGNKATKQGTAIHSTNTETIIKNCFFEKNEGARAVYLSNEAGKGCTGYFENNTFEKNIGGCIGLVNEASAEFAGTNTFTENSNTSLSLGAAGNKVTFESGSVTTFTGNATAIDNKGGNTSEVVFKSGSSATFSNNGDKDAGAIQNAAKMTFEYGSEVTFENNSANDDTGVGGAIWNKTGGELNLNGTATFKGNSDKNGSNDITSDGALNIGGNVESYSGIVSAGTATLTGKLGVGAKSSFDGLAGNGGVIEFLDVVDLIVTNNTTTGLSFIADGVVNDKGVDAKDLLANVELNDTTNTKMIFEEGLLQGEKIVELGLDTDDQGNIIVKEQKVLSESVNSKSDAVSDAGMTLKGHWRAHMNDMNKRMGDLRMANGETGVWTRMVRGESEYQGAKMQYNQYQLGYDEKLSVDKRWTVGAAVTFSEGDASYGSGSTDDKSTAFAIYGSKLNNDGTFVDLIARYAHLESDLDDRNYGTGDYSTNGMSVSAEFGKRIQQGKGLWIEPQVELTYGSVDGADVTMKNDTQTFNAHYDSMDSFIARVGFSMGKDIKQGNVYARASYLYDFDGETETQFAGGKAIKEDFGGGWWEVGVGANINLSKATYIYADIEKTFGGEVDTNWQWNLGVRYSF